MSKFTHPKCQQHKIGITILAFFLVFFQTREGIFCHLFFVDSFASFPFFIFFFMKALKGGANCLWHKRRGGKCCKRKMRWKKGGEESFLRIPPLYTPKPSIVPPFLFLFFFSFFVTKKLNFTVFLVDVFIWQIFINLFCGIRSVRRHIGKDILGLLWQE